MLTASATTLFASKQEHDFPAISAEKSSSRPRLDSRRAGGAEKTGDYLILQSALRSFLFQPTGIEGPRW